MENELIIRMIDKIERTLKRGLIMDEEAVTNDKCYAHRYGLIRDTIHGALCNIEVMQDIIKEQEDV